MTEVYGDSKRKNIFYIKYCKRLRCLKSPNEMEKAQTKGVSSNTKIKSTKEVESKSTNINSTTSIDNNKTVILKNLIKNNVDKSVLLASGFSEEEINEFMKPVNELLLNLI